MLMLVVPIGCASPKLGVDFIETGCAPTGYLKQSFATRCQKFKGDSQLLKSINGNSSMQIESQATSEASTMCRSWRASDSLIST
jgi:hypothetical protein